MKIIKNTFENIRKIVEGASFIFSIAIWSHIRSMYDEKIRHFHIEFIYHGNLSNFRLIMLKYG